MWKLAFLADKTWHLNTPNLSLQGKDHIIHEMLRDFTAFCMKLFRSHLQKCNYVRFTSPFPRQWALETIDSLIDQFNSRLIEFTAHREEIQLFSNPVDADMDTVPEDMHATRDYRSASRRHTS